MKKLDVCFARFPFGACDHPDVTDWLVATVLKAKADPRIDKVFNKRYDDTPITMTRNKAVEDARALGADLLLMVDSDMAPDLPEAGARPFWDSTLEFMLAHQGPCVVGAPYCGPPPLSNVYVFRWAQWQNDCPQPDFRLEQFAREEAAQRTGFEVVGALPTGLILIDMRLFAKLEPPYFYYEWTDRTESQKASTEDVTFTRDCALAGVPQYVNWDAWAGHWKRLRVDKPKLITVDSVQEKYRAAVLRGARSGERLEMLGEGQPEPLTALPRGSFRVQGGAQHPVNNGRAGNLAPVLPYDGGD